MWSESAGLEEAAGDVVREVAEAQGDAAEVFQSAVVRLGGAVHSALFLKPGGRLGLVLPAELLSVNYAAQVREFLMRRFARVRLVLFTERVFPGVLVRRV